MTAPGRKADIMPSEPHSIELEQALLGALLTNNEVYHRVSDFLKPDHFFEPIHQNIYELICKLVAAGKVVNPVTLNPFLPEFTVGQFSGSHYIAHLAAEATSVINSVDYADAVHDLARRRALISICRDGLALAYDSPVDVSPRQQLEELEQRLYELDEASRRRGRDLVSAGEAIARAVDGAARAYQACGSVLGVTWGLRDMDRMTTGLHRGEVTVLAGRPGMGKSALGITIAEAGAKWKPPGKDVAPTGVLIISPEMEAQALGGRMIAQEADRNKTYGQRELAYSLLRDGRFDEREWDRLIAAAIALRDLPVLIDETPSISAAGVASAVRRAAMRFRRTGYELRLIVVDYLQLIRASDRYAGKRVDEVSEISSAMKSIARSEQVAVLALSQLSREVERRDDKRPMLSDLRDSGTIEQDAEFRGVRLPRGILPAAPRAQGRNGRSL